MKIYLVRHGMDEDGFRGGWSQRGLIDRGVLQSRLLGEYLYNHPEEYGIHTILSSDLARAVETTRELEQILKIETVYSEEWREMNNGILAGMANKEAEEKYPGIYFNTLQMDTPFPGGETPRYFFNRIKNAFDNLCSKLEIQEMQSNVLLVTHGGVINLLYYLLNGHEWTNQSPFFPIDNTSVHTVERKLNKWVITERNITDHL
ncbi:histidine phosphatase family protein [Paenibacillus sp. HJL G12]|uniref:Histidine phosphatase family protein n=1 Tax=Paenibacillus dendrobii TaxID=2691084 RepID=A0A7X3IGZ4_9BACL|nr:histidine phosphatase family protein [Paenibacillus dendrobii]MWV43363.1 histidine phosphatase family protein [Paenibacillus dendrobii]